MEFKLLRKYEGGLSSSRPYIEVVITFAAYYFHWIHIFIDCHRAKHG